VHGEGGVLIEAGKEVLADRYPPLEPIFKSVEIV
jgi:hypothetical protein